MIRLKELRNSRGITQEKLAKDLNVSRTTVTMWETTGNEPDYNTLRNIANYFNTSIDYLLERTNEPDFGQNKPHTVNGVELTEAQAEAWQLIQNMDDDALKRFVAIAKAALLS